MNISPLNINAASINEDAVKHLNLQQVNNLQSFVNNKFISNYYLTQEEENTFKELIKPRVLGYGKYLKKLQHPVPALLQKLAYEHCIDYSANYKRCIDVGGSPFRTPKHHHLCTLINDNRTDARYVESALAQRNGTTTFDFSGYVTEPGKHKLCVNGAQLCTYQALYAYAVNVYDLTLEDIVKIFCSHKLLLMDLWIFLPIQLVNDLFVKDEKVYEYTKKTEKLSRFSFKDGCHHYVHNTNNWKSYIETTFIRTPDFGISVEHKCSYGTFTQIRFVKTNLINGYIERCFNMQTEDVIIPDIVFYAMNGGNAINQYTKSFRISKLYVEKLAIYGNTMGDADFKYVTFAMYANSIKTSIKYSVSGNTLVVYEGINPRNDDFERIKISMYIICAVMRYRRTKFIAKEFAFIKNNAVLKSEFWATIYQGFKHHLRKTWQQIKDFLCLTDANDKIFEGKITQIMDISILYPENMYFDNVFEAGFYVAPKIFKPSAPHFKMDDYIDLPTNVSIDSLTRSISSISLNTTSDISLTDSDISVIDSDVSSVASNVTVVSDTGATVIPGYLLRDPTRDGRCKFKDTVVIPGDGHCAEHCVRSYVTSLGHAYVSVVGMKYKNPYQPGRIVPNDWWSAEDILFAAFYNGVGVTIHHDSVAKAALIRAHMFSVNLVSGHWHFGVCCVQHKFMVIDYEFVEIIKNFTYVNCANDNLTDGAGQALAFARRFPNYKNTSVDDKNAHITLPIKNGFLKVNYQVKDVDLLLCMAEKAVRKGPTITNMNAIHQRYRLLADNFTNYIKNNPTKEILLPFIGTALFGNLLCCFKSIFDKLDGIIFTVLSNDSIRLYNKVQCTHGGFVALPIFDALTVLPEGFIDPDWHKLVPLEQRNKMAIKFEEIYGFLCTTYVEKFDFVDLSCAPGGFDQEFKKNKAKYANILSYKNFHYIGEGAFELYKGVTSIPYTSFIDAKKQIQHTIAGYDFNKHFSIYILDTSMSDDMENMLSLINTLFGDEQNFRARHVLISKFDAFADTDYYNLLVKAVAMLKLTIRCFINEGTPSKSSEVYFVIDQYYPFNDYKQHKLLETSDLLEVIAANQEKTYEKCKNAKCKCENAWKDMLNSILTYELADLDPNVIINELEDSLDYIRAVTPIETVKKYVEKCMGMNKKVSITTIDGVAGCKKTSTILRTSCAACTIIVAPYRVLVKDIQNQSTKMGLGFISFVDKLLNGFLPPKNIVLDEVFTLSGFYIQLIQMLAPDCVIYGIGDSKQIDYRNYCGATQTYDITYQSPYITESASIIPAVANLLSNYIPNITTRSKVQGGLEFKDIEDWEKLEPTKKDMMLVFGQDLKKAFTPKFPAVNTVNAVQGGRAEHVHVNLSDMQIIKKGDVVRYLYVAASRATTELVIYGNAQDRTEFYKILQSPIERAMLAIDITPIETKVLEEKDTREKIHTKVSLLKDPSAILVAEDALDRIFVPGNEATTQAIAIVNDIVPEIDNKVTIKSKSEMIQGTDNGKDATIKGKRIGRRFTQVTYHPKVKKQVMDTVIKRYCKKNANPPRELLNKYVDGFYMWIKPDWKVKFAEQMDYEHLYIYCLDYIKNLQTKYDKKLNNMTEVDYDCDVDFMKQAVVWTKILCRYYDIDLNNRIELDNVEKEIMREILEEVVYGADSKVKKLGVLKVRDDAKNRANRDNYNWIEKVVNQSRVGHAFKKLYKHVINREYNAVRDLKEEFDSAYHDYIQFHMKKQPKEIRKAGYDQEFKAGQGVSAWSKMMNIIFSSFTRMFAALMPSCVHDNIQLSQGMSDANISNFFVEHGELFNDPKLVKMTADFSEFDTAQEEIGTLSSAVILRSAGIPENLVGWYLARRKEWTLLNRDSVFDLSVLTTVPGTWKQHSGQPFTLTGNAIFNMSAMGMVYNYKNLKLAAFKGDDSIIIAERIEKIYLGEKLIVDLCGFKIKVQTPAICEYIANIITPHGHFFPDVIRRVSRVLTKVYSDHADWTEQKLSLCDCLDVVKDDEMYDLGLQAAMLYYEQEGIKITIEEIHAMFITLKTLSQKDSIDDIDDRIFQVLHFDTKA
jgi:hypothetical protein